MKISIPVLLRVPSMVICMSAGAYTFAQSGGNDFFDEYLHSALHIDSYETSYIMPLLLTFQKLDDVDTIETSFQISFKKDIIKDISPIDFNIGVAYTQTVWWQLYASSSPVRETNYGPELYIDLPFHWEFGRTGMFRGVKLAAAHKSNGYGDENDRSWNRIFFEAPISIKWFLFIPRVWWSFAGETEIPRYIGICDLTIVSQWKSHVLRVYGRTNFNLNDIKGALQVDYTYPIAATGVYAYLKYFWGYGENLFRYYQPANKIGVGVAFSR